MPSTKTLLTALPRESLRALLSAFDLVAQDGRKTDSMVRALAKGLPKDRAVWLQKLPVAVLKELIAEADVTVVGSGKAALVAALAGEPTKAAPSRAKVAASKPAKPAASKAAARKAPEASAAKPAASKTAPTTAAKPTSAKPGKPTAAKPGKSVAAASARDQASAAAVAPPAASKAKAAVAAEHTAPQAAAAPAKEPKSSTKKSSKSAPAAQAAEDSAASAGDGDTAAPKAAAPRHMLSWSEAVALATKRGQSADTMIGQPAVFSQTRKSSHCPGCKASLELQDCHIHSCDHSFVAQMGRKICAECMFERNNMSVDAFHDRLREDWQCPHCQADIPRP